MAPAGPSAGDSHFWRGGCRMTSSSWIRPLITVAVLGCVFIPAPGVARTDQTKPVVSMETAKDISPTDGAGMFRAYCAPCHGVTAKGDGPAAAALVPKPADLTQFAKRRKGSFSVRDFEEKLQGAGMVSAHGNSAMPVWGPVFRQLGSEQLRIANLRKHLESLQVK